jgi:hypothetical protein
MNDVKAYKDRLIRQISHTSMPPAARQKFIDKAAALYTRMLEERLAHRELAKAKAKAARDEKRAKPTPPKGRNV